MKLQRSSWSCCVDALLEYSRITTDLFGSKAKVDTAFAFAFVLCSFQNCPCSASPHHAHLLSLPCRQLAWHQTAAIITGGQSQTLGSIAGVAYSTLNKTHLPAIDPPSSSSTDRPHHQQFLKVCSITAHHITSHRATTPIRAPLTTSPLALACGCSLCCPGSWPAAQPPQRKPQRKPQRQRRIASANAAVWCTSCRQPMAAAVQTQPPSTTLQKTLIPSSQRAISGAAQQQSAEPTSKATPNTHKNKHQCERVLCFSGFQVSHRIL